VVREEVTLHSRWFLPNSKGKGCRRPLRLLAHGVVIPASFLLQALLVANSRNEESPTAKDALPRCAVLCMKADRLRGEGSDSFALSCPPYLDIAPFQSDSSFVPRRPLRPSALRARGGQSPTTNNRVTTIKATHQPPTRHYTTAVKNAVHRSPPLVFTF
jgi:hypothetical protein